MSLKYLKIFFDFDEVTEELSYEERGRLIIGMVKYAKGEENIPITGNEKFLFAMFRHQIDREQENYDKTVEINRRNGKLGGRPRKTETNEITEPVYEEPDDTDELDELFGYPI